MEDKKENLLKYLIDNHEFACGCGKKIDLKPIFKDVIKDICVYLENNNEILFGDLSDELESIFRVPSVEDMNSIVNKEKIMFGETHDKNKQEFKKEFSVFLKRKSK